VYLIFVALPTVTVTVCGAGLEYEKVMLVTEKPTSVPGREKETDTFT
jgi:hypothetical protein